MLFCRTQRGEGLVDTLERERGRERERDRKRERDHKRERQTERGRERQKEGEVEIGQECGASSRLPNFQGSPVIGSYCFRCKSAERSHLIEAGGKQTRL